MPIPSLITGLTGISDDMVSDSEPFKQVAQEFLRFLTHHSTNKDVILVAHNGVRFDIPFLFSELQRNNINVSHIKIKGQIDTLTLAKSVITTTSKHRQVIPQNYKLSTLYKYVTGDEFNNGHRAYEDTKAAILILT